MAACAQPRLDVVHRRLRLLDAAVRHQPAGGFRQPQAHEENHAAERGADEKRQSPAQIRRQQGGIEQHDRARRAQRGAEPEAAVDHEVGPAAVARRHQLLDRRVDGGVFAADAGAGEKAEQREAPEIPRQRGRRGGDEIDRERDEEQPLATQPVGEPAEEQSTQYRPREIGAAREPHIDVGESEPRTLLEGGRYGAGERHLEAVENPGDAERDDDEGMETAPPQPVEPRRDIGGDDPRFRARRRAFRGNCRRYRHCLLTSGGLRSSNDLFAASVPLRSPACFPPAPQHHRLDPPVIKPSPSKEPRPMSSTALTWIVIGVIVALVLWIITIYNGLVAMRQRVNQAFSDIDVQTKQRHDLIPNLVETVKGYASHERGTLEAVVQARNAAVTAQSGGVAAQAAAENVLTGALRQLFALSESYPDLKASQNFQQLQAQLSDIENKLAAARRFFNNAVQEYNTGIQQFPAVLLAGSLGFTPKEFFDVGAEERKVLEQAPQVKF